jgi:hypothetical protein
MKLKNLCFPIERFKVPDETVILRDFEILGVGSLRKCQLDRLRSKGALVLETYPHIVPLGYELQYEEELAILEAWLEPLSLQVGTATLFEIEARALFFRIFPLFSRVFRDHIEQFLADYFLDAPRSSLLLQDFWCYFIGFVRLKKVDLVYVELANWEWTAVWLEARADHKYSGDPGQLIRSPHAEVVHLSKDNPYLDRRAGSYLFYFDRAKCKIEKVVLEPLIAIIFDLLEEERKFSIQGLQEQVELRGAELDFDLQCDIRGEIEQMIKLGLLIQLS